MELGARHRGPESPSCRCWAEINRKSENVYKPRREQAEGPPEEGGGKEGADTVLRVAQGVGALKEPLQLSREQHSPLVGSGNMYPIPLSLYFS